MFEKKVLFFRKRDGCDYIIISLSQLFCVLYRIDVCYIIVSNSFCIFDLIGNYVKCLIYYKKYNCNLIMTFLMEKKLNFVRMYIICINVFFLKEIPSYYIRNIYLYYRVFRGKKNIETFL